jgi:hypothetical protein
MVDIYVGPSKQNFPLHKHLLCTKVPYFRKMFESTFKEGVEQAATLPEDDPNAFALFVQWLYRDSLTPLDIRKHSPPENDIFLDRIRLYCFAEKILLPNLMDLTMTILFSNYKKLGKMPTDEAVGLAYQHSGPKSPIRTFMTRSVAWSITQQTSTSWTTEGLAGTLMTSGELTYDVVELLRGTSSVKLYGPCEVDRCKLHVHEESSQACQYKGEIL